MGRSLTPDLTIAQCSQLTEIGKENVHVKMLILAVEFLVAFRVLNILSLLGCIITERK